MQQPEGVRSCNSSLRKAYYRIKSKFLTVVSGALYNLALPSSLTSSDWFLPCSIHFLSLPGQSNFIPALKHLHLYLLLSGILSMLAWQVHSYFFVCSDVTSSGKNYMAFNVRLPPTLIFCHITSLFYFLHNIYKYLKFSYSFIYTVDCLESKTLLLECKLHGSKVFFALFSLWIPST